MNKGKHDITVKTPSFELKGKTSEKDDKLGNFDQLVC